MNDENLKPVEKLTPFTKMIMTIGTLPSSFYASMSYYESMVWLYEYLKNEIIPAVNNNGDAVSELQEKYIELHDYVEHYFDNLDVQQEINNKLDEMAEDGTLTNLIKGYVDPIYQAYENEINYIVSTQNGEITNFKNSVNTQISIIDEKVTNATTGSPKGVYATLSDLETADPDHNYIYVVTADGNWYYYNSTDSEWTSGGTYQSTSIGDNEIDYNNLKLQLQNMFARNISPTIIDGTYIARAGSTGSSAQYSITSDINLKKGETIYLKGAVADTLSAIARVNANGTYTSMVNGLNNTAVNEYEYQAPYDMKVKLCFRNDYDYLYYIFISTYDLYNQYWDIKTNYLYAFNHITAIGDSLTYSQVYTSANESRQAYKPYPNVIADIIGADCEIFATPGATTQWWWNNYNTQLTNNNKDNLFLIYLGSNGGLTDTLDTDAPISEPDYNNYANTNTGCYAKIVAKCKSLGGKIILIPPFTVGNDPTALATTIKVIDDICDRYGVFRINSIELTDLNYHYWPNLQGYNTSHMNDIGYSVFAQKVINEISKIDSNTLTRLILQ